MNHDLDEKVEWLRVLVSAGAYRIYPEKIAEAMLAEHRPRTTKSVF